MGRYRFIKNAYWVTESLATEEAIYGRWLEPLWDHENLFETAVVRTTVTISAIPGGMMEIIVGYLFGVRYYKRMLCVLIRIASSRRF